MVANKSKATDDRYRRFIRAVEQGTHFLINRPDESWKLFIGTNKKLDDELNRRAWRDTLPRFDLRPAAVEIGRYERFARFLKDQGLIKSVRPIQEYAIELR